MEKLAKQIITPPRKANLGKWPKNFGIRLLSLFFAVFLWYFVAGEDRIDTNVYIPVEIVNLPRNMVVSNQYKKQLEVTISGPRGLINGINRQHISRTINLSTAKPGTTVVVKNERDSIRFPRGIDVLRIQPSNITLLLDRLIEKSLPVKADVTGVPLSGFELTEITFDPQSILISGPQGVLKDESALVTEPIDVTGLKAPVTRQVALALKPEILERIGETVVSARIIINEKSVKKTIKDIPIAILDDKSGGTGPPTVLPDRVTVHALVPISLSRTETDLKTLIQARVVAESLPPGKHSVPVDISASDNITIVDLEPQSVILEIGAAPAEVRQ